MAGGKGERFWPLSTESRPKQLLPITSGKNMLQETIDRIITFVPKERIHVVAGRSIADAIDTSCKNIERKNILAEPKGKNTCMAIGLAAVRLRKTDPEAVMVVLSADHLIRPASKLINVIEFGCEIAAAEDKLITIGISPTRAETGYGYIELGEQIREKGGIAVFEVSGFKEKPRAAVANQYFYDRRHLWNSGMFIWSVKSIMKALETCMPEMYEQLTAYEKHIGKSTENEALEKLYNEAESISIDFAILEQADNVITIRGDFIWDDVGSWLALQRFLPKDNDNNVVVGPAMLLNSYESTVYNSDGGLIAVLGASDLVIAKAGDVVLVAHKTALDQLKDMIAKLGTDERFVTYLK
jgi:mannose-1-phosphate guanylyltransferase